MAREKDPRLEGADIHKLRLPPGLSKAGRQRRADRLGDKMKARGFKIIKFEDGGLLGNSYLYIEGPGPGPLDVWGIVERFVTACVLVYAVYFFYTRFMN